jgi:murein DD-endopeptidase MepM/ murein hydrolase activator NlpD
MSSSLSWDLRSMNRPILRRGDKGPDVSYLQSILATYGYQKNQVSRGVKTDSVMGLATCRALMAFQARTGLTPDGICGPKSWTALDAVQSNILGPLYQWPFADFWHITSPQGWRRLGGQRQYHGGLDIGSPQGTEIYSPYKGQVAYKHEDHPTGGGLLIVSSVSGWGYALCHLSRISLEVGDPVKRGQLVGLSGGTPGTRGAGYSTGPHLHISTQVWGQSIDPSGLIDINPVPVPPDALT